jgi:hypothetical protein
MVYLGIAVFCAIAVLLWKLRSRPDPHHTFMMSLLPLLDLEHTAGSASEQGEEALKRKSQPRAAA